MDHYHIWVNLKNTHEDIAFARAIDRYLGMLKQSGAIETFSLQRRKLGFGPRELGEFHIDIATKDMTQLDAAFRRVAPRSGELEAAHAAVYSAVTDFTAALYRDFPDPERVPTNAG